MREFAVARDLTPATVSGKCTAPVVVIAERASELVSALWNRGGREGKISLSLDRP